MKPIVSISRISDHSGDHNFYIDKTAFIKRMVENQDTVTVITAPGALQNLEHEYGGEFFSIQSKAEENLFTGAAEFGKKKYRELTANIR